MRAQGGLEARVRAMVAAMPADGSVTLTVAALRAWLAEERAPIDAAEPPAEPLPLTWREKLWCVPAETRIGVHELTESLGKPRSWVYRHTSVKSAAAAGLPLLPHRKLDGELVFVVGELRAWLRDHEEVVAAGRMETTAVERRLPAIDGGRGR